MGDDLVRLYFALDLAEPLFFKYHGDYGDLCFDYPGT